MADLEEYTREVALRARDASRELATATGNQKINWLRRSAELIRLRTAELQRANAQDIEKAAENDLTPAAIDRLQLTDDGLEAIAVALEEIVMLPDLIDKASAVLQLGARDGVVLKGRNRRIAIRP